MALTTSLIGAIPNNTAKIYGDSIAVRRGSYISLEITQSTPLGIDAIQLVTSLPTGLTATLVGQVIQITGTVSAVQGEYVTTIYTQIATVPQEIKILRFIVEPPHYEQRLGSNNIKLVNLDATATTFQIYTYTNSTFTLANTYVLQPNTTQNIVVNDGIYKMVVGGISYVNVMLDTILKCDQFISRELSSECCIDFCNYKNKIIMHETLEQIYRLYYQLSYPTTPASLTNPAGDAYWTSNVVTLNQIEFLLNKLLTLCSCYPSQGQDDCETIPYTQTTYPLLSSNNCGC